MGEFSDKSRWSSLERKMKMALKNIVLTDMRWGNIIMSQVEEESS